jgi:hypothetical protein
MSFLDWTRALSFLLYRLTLLLHFYFDTTLWLLLSPGPNILLPFPHRYFLLLANFQCRCALLFLASLEHLGRPAYLPCSCILLACQVGTLV